MNRLPLTVLGVFIATTCTLAGCATPSSPSRTTSNNNSGAGQLAFMVMVANSDTGAWQIATNPVLNTASYNAHAACPGCGDIGSCAWTNYDPSSPTWGAVARSGYVDFLGKRQFMFGYGCGRSEFEAESRAVALCTEPGVSCAAVGALPLVQ